MRKGRVAAKEYSDLDAWSSYDCTSEPDQGESVGGDSFWQEKVPPNCSVTTVQIENGVPCIVRENEIFYKEKVRQWNTV